MAHQELVTKLKTAIADYERLVEEQQRQRERYQRLVHHLHERDAAISDDRELFGAIRNQDDFDQLSDEVVVALLVTATQYLSTYSHQGATMPVEGCTEHATRSIVLIWAAFVTRQHLFGALAPHDLAALRAAVSSSSFLALSFRVLTPEETQQLCSFLASHPTNAATLPKQHFFK